MVFDTFTGIFFCWVSCAYTVHVVEMVLRNEGRSLLGDLPTRQKKCIKALIRLSALQENSQKTCLINHYVITLLGLVFDNSYFYKDTCILDWDPFGMLVSLVMCLTSLFSLSVPSPLPNGGVLDLYTTKLMLVATMTQILIALEFPIAFADEEEPAGADGAETDEDEATRCLQTYWKILGKPAPKVNTSTLWKEVTNNALPFLRCCCIFFRYLTGVPAPDCLKEVGGDTYENMCRYLGLPTGCQELLDNDVVINVFRNWTDNWRKQRQRQNAATRIGLSAYLDFRGLISLPEDYSELINSVSLFTCPNSDHEDSRNPTLCLVCGTMLCSQSYCCQKELNGNLVSRKKKMFVFAGRRVRTRTRCGGPKGERIISPKGGGGTKRKLMLADGLQMKARENNE